MNYLSLFKSLLIIYLMLGVMLYLFQRSMIYYPSAATAHNFKTLTWPNSDIMVEALVTHDQGQHAILYFGGNAENVAYTAGDFFQEFPRHTTYLMKYRGYSGAEGTATETDLYSDALTLFDQIKGQHNQVKVIGRSLGSGIATYLASQRPVDQLVLVTPFDSLRNVAQNMLPVYPMAWLLKDSYDSITHIKELKTSTLVLAALHDQVIPSARTQSLIKAIPPQLLRTAQINAGHNDLDLSPEYFAAIKTFLNSSD